MPSDDWFRSEAWPAKAQELFETKLAKARRANRAQYLRIKAFTLLQSRKRDARSDGVQLLHRLLDNHPDDVLEVADAHELLAQAYREAGDLPQVRRTSVHASSSHLASAAQRHPRSNARGGLDRPARRCEGP